MSTKNKVARKTARRAKKRDGRFEMRGTPLRLERPEANTNDYVLKKGQLSFWVAIGKIVVRVSRVRDSSSVTMAAFARGCEDGDPLAEITAFADDADEVISQNRGG